MKLLNMKDGKGRMEVNNQ